MQQPVEHLSYFFDWDSGRRDVGSFVDAGLGDYYFAIDFLINREGQVKDDATSLPHLGYHRYRQYFQLWWPCLHYLVPGDHFAETCSFLITDIVKEECD